VAYLFQEEPPAGALADDYCFVAIKAAGDFTKPWVGEEIVWTAKERQPLFVLWVDDHCLEVLLSRGTTNLTTMRTPSERFSVTTRVLRSTRKFEVAGSGERASP